VELGHGIVRPAPHAGVAHVIIGYMTLRAHAALAAFVFSFAPVCASAAVIDSAASGFTVKTTLEVQAAPAVVYDALVHKVGDWWNPAHTFSGDAHNLSIQDKAMGCFCETLPNGGAVRHMEVVFVAPGKALNMSGGLGPLQSVAVAGSMQIKLSPADTGTKLEVTYAVGGYLAAGLNTWAAPVDMVLAEQFTRLKNYVEHGNPAPK
jgi:uncharacterized protein YndB with AHSA1/START domain